MHVHTVGKSGRWGDGGDLSKASYMSAHVCSFPQGGRGGGQEVDIIFGAVIRESVRTWQVVSGDKVHIKWPETGPRQVAVLGICVLGCLFT